MQLALSDVFILVLNPQHPQAASTLVELGAAASWQKPVFVVLVQDAGGELPVHLRRYPVYPLSRLDDLVRAVKRSVRPLSELEQQRLLELYKKRKKSIDDLLQNPEDLDDLTTEFNRQTGSRAHGERLLSELLRLGVKKTG